MTQLKLGVLLFVIVMGFSMILEKFFLIVQLYFAFKAIEYNKKSLHKVNFISNLEYETESCARINVAYKNVEETKKWIGKKYSINHPIMIEMNILMRNAIENFDLYSITRCRSEQSYLSFQVFNQNDSRISDLPNWSFRFKKLGN